ncbi:MAG: nicotinate (nicotinamide) nucleotide adenylyltransferase [Clostridia bacterium]|nr:nicotinate (nicotinamide) nucleotide adenylyltransferase [Clostridia bacterium]
MRIGIYGGTFSPPHIGHIRAAEAFISEMELDMLIVVPAFCSPGKAGMVQINPHQRLDMCSLAFNMAKCHVSDIEIKREGKSYTFLTLKEMKSIYPDSELFFLIGSDKLTSLHRWKRIEDMIKMCSFVYMKRDGEIESNKKSLDEVSSFCKQFGVKIRHISTKTFETSSEIIREKIRCGENVSHLLTPEVFDYIKENKLYM